MASPINNSAYSELHYGFVVNNTKYSSEIDSIQKMEQIILKSLLIYTYFEMHNLDFLTMGHKCHFFPFLGYPTKGPVPHGLVRLLGRFTAQFQRPLYQGYINRYNIIDFGHNKRTFTEGPCLTRNWGT